MSQDKKLEKEKTVADRDLRTEPERSVSSEKHARNVTYFRCLGCGFEFSLPDTAYEDEPYTSNCLECDRAISIQTVQSQSSMDVIELFGCEYGRRGLDVTGSLESAQPASSEQILSWIKDQAGEAQAEIRPDPFSSQATFIDGLVSKWLVTKKKGKTYEFEYFAALRNAIEDGRVSPDDKITAPDGVKYKVSEYPGTADLFGNRESNRTGGVAGPASRRTGTRWEKVVNNVYRIVLVGLVFASLASTVYWGPKYYAKWRQFQGEQLVKRLTSNTSVAPGETFETVWRDAKRLLKTGDPELISDASRQLEKALLLRPRAIDVVSALAESLTELGALTADRLDLANAKKLVDYAKNLDPQAGATVRAEAHLLWKTGRAREGIARMESEPEDFLRDPANVYLLARMEMDAQNYNRAALHLNQALRASPSSVMYLTSFSELNERQGKFDQAALYLEKAQAVSRDPSAFTERLADLFMKAKEVDSAAQVYRRAIRRGETTEKNYLGLVRVLASAGRNQETITASLQYLTTFPAGAHSQEIQEVYRKSLAAIDPTVSSGTEAAGGPPARRRSPLSRR
ncbi:MAG: tetratricopeptide repeat protein [Pseudomonadota bacterium]